MNYLEVLDQLVREYAPDHHNLTPETTFEELGMDGIDLVDFMLKVEEKFDIVVPDSKMLDLHSIQDVLDMISESIGQEENIKSC